MTVYSKASICLIYLKLALIQNDTMTNQTLVNNNRIVKNTAYLYIRMLILMIVNLYTSRVVLKALGIEDYGVYNAVGGFISMFSMISAALSTAISRYITFTLGENNPEKLRLIFSTGVIIQLFLSIVLVLVSETVGVWFLANKMTIPVGRELAAHFVFQFSVATFVINLLSVPYNAVLIAHERMSAFAYIGIFEGFSALLVALVLQFSPFDSLIIYSLLMCLVAFIIRLIYASYSKRHFDETRGALAFDKEHLKNMLGFAGWNFIGVSFGVLRSQGINLLFNVYNGPVVNAARGISMQIFNAVNKFSGGFYTAVQPQITKSYAAGFYQEANRLVCDSSRWAFYLLLLIGLPILSETDYLLRLWLLEIPTSTAVFVKIIVGFALIEAFSQPLIYLMLATGKIRNYQIIVGSLCLLNFPVAWIILYLGYSPALAQSTTILFSFLSLIVRVLMLKRMTSLSIRYFTFNTLGRASLVTALSMIIPYIISMSYTECLLRFVVGTLCSEIIAILLILVIGLNKIERVTVLRKLKHTMYYAK